jgi:radical SAM superfamily enzyme YgiQ (UPF0313 family)
MRATGRGNAAVTSYSTTASALAATKEHNVSRQPRILLINVCMRYDVPLSCPPVGLACIATALRDAGFPAAILDVDLHRLTDSQIAEHLEQTEYDIVGLGNIISGYRHTKRLCRIVKSVQPRALMVVGNTVASIPEKLLAWNPEIDVAVIGEGDSTIVDLVTAWRDGRDLAEVPGIALRRDGKTVRTSPRACIPRMEDIPFPDYTLFEIEKYLEMSWRFVPEPHPIPRERMLSLPVNTARGCPFDCSFCHHAFKACPYRYYPFDQVIGFFKGLQDRYGVMYLNFWDELTLLTKARTVELCDALERHGCEAYWPVAPRGNLFGTGDLDLLKRCKSLGATTIGGALESASPEILASMNKKITADQFVEQMRTARRAGLTPNTSVVFGYPQETPETIALTLKTCERAGVYPSAGYVLPLPNTPIYNLARSRGLIEEDEEQYLLRIADRQDLHVNLTSMPDEQLIETVTKGLIRLKDALGIPLSDQEVIKTSFYRAARRAEPGEGLETQGAEHP